MGRRVRAYVPLDNKVVLTCEMGLLAAHPLVEFSEESIFCYGVNGKSRYDGLLAWCETELEYTDDAGAADIAILPHKFRGVDDPTYARLNQTCLRVGLMLLAFYNDVDERSYEMQLGSTTLLFRTSMINRNQRAFPREIAVAPIIPDCYNGVLLANDAPISIGFCGDAAVGGRERALRTVERAAARCPDIHALIIRRSGFRAPEVPAIVAREEYLYVMERCLFCLCQRGVGNFSDRLYEALMMGRIPIIVNTDCVIPHFEHLCKLCVVVNLETIEHDLDRTLRAFYSTHAGGLKRAQLACRAFWVQHYTATQLAAYALSFA